MRFPFAIMKHTIIYSGIRIYSAIMDIGSFLAAPVLGSIKAAAAWNVAERTGLPPLRAPQGDRPAVWVHAASLGEAKLALKFLELLNRKHPDDVYLLTATTRTGVAFCVRTRRSGRSGGLSAFRLHAPDPRAMLTTFRVKRVWLMETELWPSLMASCLITGVPVGIANGRMEEKSFAVYRRFRPLCAPLFAALDIVLAQSESYGARFRSMGTRSEAIHITGNLKRLVEIAPPPREQRRSLRAALCLAEGDFVLTAGCVHAGEGAKLKETLLLINNNARAVKCIVVPRHLSDTAALIEELGSTAVRLQSADSSEPWSVCVIDKMGILEDMYKAADAAFIGGTFVSVGGHSAWDAAQFALPVFSGPDYHTQRDSFDQLIEAGVAFPASSADELAKRISALLQNPAAAPVSGFSSLMQASRHHIEHIEGLLP